MRQSPNYLLRRAADTTVIVPLGRAAVDFPGMITVNETGEFLWNLLSYDQTAATLADALCQHYAVAYPQALADTETFLRRLSAVGAVTDYGG